MSLSPLRRQIDRIDLELLRLLNARATLALRVGQVKRQRRQAVFDPRRERAVLRRIVASTDGPLPTAAIRAIFQGILRQSRSLQAMGTTEIAHSTPRPALRERRGRQRTARRGRTTRR